MDLKGWIDSVGGVRKAAERLGVKERTVRSWYAMNRTPRPEHARKIIDVSNQVLDCNDIYMPYLGSIGGQNNELV